MTVHDRILVATEMACLSKWLGWGRFSHWCVGDLLPQQ